MKDDYIVVTNNSLLKDEKNIVFVEGDFLDVLKKTRDFLHNKYLLISHPLPASIRMMLSPTRSIIISKDICSDELFYKSLEIMESSITSYINTLGERKPDYRNLKDYEKIDKSLLLSAFDEILIESKTVKEFLEEENK